MRPTWLQKTKTLLTHLGYNVLDESGFQCCGSTLRSAGRIKAATKLQSINVTHWERLGSPKIITFCASCHCGLFSYDPSFLSIKKKKPSWKSNEDLLTCWRKKLTPLTSLLDKNQWELALIQPIEAEYHQPCHSQQPDPDKAFLVSLLPRIQQGKSLCCGMGGILQICAPSFSAKLAKKCVQAFSVESAAILTGCSGCIMQLQAHSQTPTYHYLDILSV